MKRAISLFMAVFVIGSVAALVPATPAGAAPSIEVTEGTYRGVMSGIDKVYAAGYGCRRIPKARLASVLLAIPKSELAGWEPPSPASFGRSDNRAADPRNERLYSFGRDDGVAPRAFWTPGIGIYQLDTLNLRLTAFQKSNTRRATQVVGRLIIQRWCQNGYRAARALVASTWVACADNSCWRTARGLYDKETKSLRNVTRTRGRSVTGRVKSRWCWSADRPGVYVRCRYFDISALQGVMNEIAPNGGAGPNPYTPLPADFVELTIPTATGAAEARVFMPGNTGYGQEIWAIRPKGSNPRTSVEWYVAGAGNFGGDLSVWSCYRLGANGCSWSSTTAR